MNILLKGNDENATSIHYVRDMNFKNGKIEVLHWPDDWDKVAKELNDKGYKTKVYKGFGVITELKIEDIKNIYDTPDTIYKTPFIDDKFGPSLKGMHLKFMRVLDDKIVLIHSSKTTQEWFDKVYRTPDKSYLSIDPEHKLQLIDGNVCQVIDRPKEFLIEGDFCENWTECYKISKKLLNVNK